MMNLSKVVLLVISLLLVFISQVGAANGTCEAIVSNYCADFGNINAKVSQTAFDSAVQAKYNEFKKVLTSGDATCETEVSSNVRYLKTLACAFVIKDQGCAGGAPICPEVCTQFSNSLNNVSCINAQGGSSIFTQCTVKSLQSNDCLEYYNVELSTCGYESAGSKTDFCAQNADSACCKASEENTDDTKNITVPMNKPNKSKDENEEGNKKKGGGFFKSKFFIISMIILALVVAVLGFFYYVGSKDEKEERMRNLELGNRNQGYENMGDDYTPTVEINKDKDKEKETGYNYNDTDYGYASNYNYNNSDDKDPFDDSNQVDPSDNNKNISSKSYDNNYSTSPYDNNYSTSPYENNYSTSPYDNKYSSNYYNKNYSSYDNQFNYRPYDDYSKPYNNYSNSQFDKSYNDVQKSTSYQNQSLAAPVDYKKDNPFDSPNLQNHDDSIDNQLSGFPMTSMPAVNNKTKKENSSKNIPSNKNINIGDDILKPSMVTLTEIKTPQESNYSHGKEEEEEEEEPKKGVVNMIDIQTPSSKEVNTTSNLTPSILITSANGEVSDVSHEISHNHEEDVTEEFSEMPEPKPFRAIHAYEPQIDDELRLEVDNDIDVLYEYDDGWCWAFNKTTGEQGACPLLCLVSAKEEASGEREWEKEMDVVKVPGRRDSMLSTSFDTSNLSFGNTSFQKRFQQM